MQNYKFAWNSCSEKPGRRRKKFKILMQKDIQITSDYSNTIIIRMSKLYAEVTSVRNYAFSQAKDQEQDTKKFGVSHGHLLCPVSGPISLRVLFCK